MASLGVDPFIRFWMKIDWKSYNVSTTYSVMAEPLTAKGEQSSYIKMFDQFLQTSKKLVFQLQQHQGT